MSTYHHLDLYTLPHCRAWEASASLPSTTCKKVLILFIRLFYKGTWTGIFVYVWVPEIILRCRFSGADHHVFWDKVSLGLKPGVHGLVRLLSPSDLLVSASLEPELQACTTIPDFVLGLWALNQVLMLVLQILYWLNYFLSSLPALLFLR